MPRLLRRALLAAFVFVLEPAAGASAEFKPFRSPSGNIGCYVDTSAGARCDIAERDWTVSRPAGCPSDMDFGQGLIVTRRGRGHVVCAGDTALGAGKILAYGRSVSAGRYTCTSRTSGVTCRNGKSGHGFFISRASYRLF